jgi:signal transduction histidine kinase
VTDSLARFGQAVLAVRWGVTAICLTLAGPDIADGDGGLLVALLVVAAVTVARTLRPLRDDGSARGVAAIALEAVIAVGVVLATGPVDSPLLFTLLVPAALAGFARGFRFGLQVAGLALLVVGLAWFDDGGDAQTASQWAGEVVLLGLVAAYARRILFEADERRAAAVDRLGRLSDANVLLFQLHQVAQSLPASLDLTEALDATVEQLRSLFDATAGAILLHEPTDGSWSTARRFGLPDAEALPGEELPPALAHTLAVRSTALVEDLAANGPGLHPGARSGLYGVLTARGATIGLIALEHPDPAHFAERDVELLTGFVDPAALALDNARWFGRIRSVGADEERARLARDLHDRTGQSLAYLAFELDRITKRAGQGAEVTEALDALRGDVRKVVSELRDTLYDLRTDVTEADGLASTLAAFLERVAERSGVATELHAQETARLPLAPQREVWRLARDVVTQVEQGGQASRIEVLWRCDGATAELEVLDHAAGGGAPGSMRTPELASLRERAAGIGATLAVLDEPGRGTRVRCTLAG